MKNKIMKLIMTSIKAFLVTRKIHIDKDVKNFK